LNHYVGISVNGILLHSGASEYGYDAYYPKAYGGMNNPQAVKGDICLGSSDYQNIYTYYMFSPCMYDIDLKQ